jgi:hypothetical protein
METLEQRYELYVEMTKRFEPNAYIKTFDEWLNS